MAEAAHALGHRILRADLAGSTPTCAAWALAADARRGQWGLAVLTALPVTGYEVADLGRTPGERMSRAAQLVTVTTPAGASLRVVNTHLTYRLFSPVQLVRLTRRLAASVAPTVIAGDLNMPGPVSGLAVGYSPRCTARTFPAHRPLLQLRPDAHQPGRPNPRREGAAPAVSDHLPIRACLRVV